MIVGTKGYAHILDLHDLRAKYPDLNNYPDRILNTVLDSIISSFEEGSSGAINRNNINLAINNSLSSLGILSEDTILDYETYKSLYVYRG